MSLKLKFLTFLSLPLLLNVVATLLLPRDIFTYRAWETLLPYVLTFEGPFYPNQDLSLVARGDLGYRTPYSVPRSVSFQTDSFGFRSSSTDTAPSEIVIVGDSFVVGSGLTQADTFASMLEHRLGRPVYPYAPASISEYVMDRFTFSKADTVILALAERNIGPGLCGLSESLPVSQGANARELGDARKTSTTISGAARFMKIAEPVKVELDRFLRNPSYLVRHVAGILQNRRVIVAGEMLYHEESIAMRDVSEIEGVVSDLKACQSWFDQQEIEFVFVPLPAKETIHYDSIPTWAIKHTESNRAAYLEQLISALRRENVIVVDTLQAFRAATDAGTEIYQKDDTHWNREGVSITVDLLAPGIRNE